MNPHELLILSRSVVVRSRRRWTVFSALLVFLATAVFPTAFAQTVVADDGGPAKISPLLLDEIKIVASDGAAGDQFSYDAVSIDGDTVLVGAFLDDDNGNGSGSAYIFQRNQGGADNWGEVKKITASDGSSGDYFGFSTAVCGDIAVVGACLDDPSSLNNAGSAYVFYRNQGGANNWGQVRKLVASDAATTDYFGHGVSIDGDTIMIGARGDDSMAGSAYIFQRNQGGADNWGQVKKIVASDRAADAWFGSYVALDGDTAIVSAYRDDSNGTDSGSVYIFSRNQGGANNWGEVAKLTALDIAAGDLFGRSVAICGDTVIAGSMWHDDDGTTNTGAAYIYRRNEGGADNWGQVTNLVAPDSAEEDYFGASVAIDSNVAVVTASWDDDHGADSGSAYVFELDFDPPTPDPMTWSIPPVGGSPTSITMTATTASDPSGVEYFFECAAGAGHDSGWQDSPTYVDDGLDDSTSYTYRVRARDKSTYQNVTAWSDAVSTTTLDATAPTPDPMTWAIAPTAAGATSITMTATTATDPSGVEYFFECAAGAGHDSGWQDSPTYVDTGLDDMTTYTYRVRARDKSAAQNTTDWSTAASATTLDGAPPTPDPMTWASAPRRASTSSISMTASTASDVSGVEYCFECVSGGGHDSGWQDDPHYEDAGLIEGQTYTYRARARDKSTLQNATAWSDTRSAAPGSPATTVQEEGWLLYE
ncbi:FG-GAP repeat protein [Candidatus Sumerlaeota bacterium]|nr:FG-GAP repeat protein [Candidatus Sumerlaeota bacterium]